MLQWSAEHVTEITTELIELELLPTSVNVERGVHNLDFVLQQLHTALMALTSYEANDVVANSRKKPLEAWPRLLKRYDPTTEESGICFARRRCSLLELQGEIERRESCVVRYEKKLKDKIRPAGLEAFLPEELTTLSTGIHYSRKIRQKAMASKRPAKANRTSHGPRVLAKESVRKARDTENPKEHPKVPRVPKVRTRIRLRKLVYLVLKTRNQRQV